MNAEPALLEVGRIVRAHGLRGQVVVELVTNRRERVERGSILQAGAGRSLEVLSASAQPSGRWLVSFAGVDDRGAAEALAGAVLRAAPLADVTDVLWIHELIGSEVTDSDGTPRGVVTDVQANPASDLLVLDTGALVPLAFVVDFAHRRVRIDPPPGLFEL